MAARDYRAKGKGQRIAYCTSPSALGRVLVAATPRGVCSIKLGGAKTFLVGLLQEEFSEAELADDTQTLAALRDRILSFLEGNPALAKVPMDVRGTEFQRRVWDELRRIPAGETRTYTQIAQAVGAPRAVRAVGSACGANPVALLVPCHRAVRSDGGLGGYAWGLARKKRLLELERRKGKKQ